MGKRSHWVAFDLAAGYRRKYMAQEKTYEEASGIVAKVYEDSNSFSLDADPQMFYRPSKFGQVSPCPGYGEAVTVFWNPYKDTRYYNKIEVNGAKADESPPPPGAVEKIDPYSAAGGPGTWVHKDASIQAQCALKAAVEYCNDEHSPDEVLTIATSWLDWIRDQASGNGNGGQAPAEPEKAPESQQEAAVGARTPVPSVAPGSHAEQALADASED